MAAVVEPLPPVPVWWEPASLRVVSEKAASAALACLDGMKPCYCIVGRLTVPAKLKPGAQMMHFESHVAQRILPHVNLQQLRAQGIRVDQVDDRCGHPYEYNTRRGQNRWEPILLFTCLTTRPVEEVTEEVLRHCNEQVAQRWAKNGPASDPEAWRRSDPRESAVVITGPALAMDVVSGPFASVLAGWGEHKGQDLPFSAGFEVEFNMDFEQAARSMGTADLQLFLEKCLGDVGVLAKGKGCVSALHLAALTGHPGVVAAIVDRTAAAVSGVRALQDPDGRSPLHLAALFDSAEMIHSLLRVCDATVKDKWGRTALDTANDLQHHAAAAVLQGRPGSLNELSSWKLCRLLRSGAADLGTLPAGELSDLIPLHDYRAWANLAATVGGVDPSTVLRSMSCFECWCADVLGRKVSAALPSHTELIRVWDDLASFETPATTAAEPDVAVLAEAPSPRKVPTVADRATFLERFHRRTGGVFEGFDWSNLMVIGGMVLACLIADDEEYARDFCDTDVDIYVVGAGMSANKWEEGADRDSAGSQDDADDSSDDDTGKTRRSAFHKRVMRLMTALPDSERGLEWSLEIGSESLQSHAGDPGVEFERDDAHNRLILTGKSAALADESLRDEDCRRFKVGDFIVSVNDDDTVDGMVQELTSREPAFEEKCLTVRPSGADALPVSATVVRTPQTLTACLVTSSGEALPNVQVVLAPYASPAHLLFTTDIDCTAMGFDGEQLYATPRAREAIRLRQNIARPEKYMVRGEWRTEARLLKYAARGFRVVDLGIQPHAVPAANEEVASAAKRGRKGGTSARVERVQATGVHGAQLLMLAGRDDDLRQLLVHEEPLLRAGMNWDELLNLVTAGGNVRSRSYGRQRGPDNEGNSKERLVHYNDGYGKAAARLVMVNPAKPGLARVEDYSLRCHESSISEAIKELDLEVDRFEVRGWYEGIDPGDLRPEHATLDPAVWKGVGDFRRAD